jgi:hypothetical protein
MILVDLFLFFRMRFDLPQFGLILNLFLDFLHQIWLLLARASDVMKAVAKFGSVSMSVSHEKQQTVKILIRLLVVTSVQYK